MHFAELKKKKIKIKDFSICGGVAANQYINGLLKNFIEDKGIAYHQVPHGVLHRQCRNDWLECN